MLSDIEISKNAKLKDIREIAKKINISEDDLELYGKYKAKVNIKQDPKAKLILVTAINPTSAGEGKTTISIGLADGLARIGKNVCLALREPSLGPVFGVKGGAAGGGYSQVIPMEDINLHFTGDLHAITSANNLLSAMIDNHIFSGNEKRLNPNKIFFKRCLDMNDRALRYIEIGLNNCGTPREENFEITAASEIMAILCLSRDLKDLKRRIGGIIVGENEDGEYVYCRDLKADGAMTALLKDAIKPNLVQTLEGTPAFIHGGPFANIAHGCNSIIATKTAMTVADYVVTEAGFGADLGAEKFLDVKCRIAGIEPQAIVLVATVRALKLHGGANKQDLATENLEALRLGLPNLIKHLDNMKNIYKKPTICAINRFYTDTEKEIALIEEAVEKYGSKVVLADVFAKGGAGGEKLAEAVCLEAEKASKLEYSYPLDIPVAEKIEMIVKKIYGGDGVEFTDIALSKIQHLEKCGYKNLPVLIAKTQYSLSDDAKLLAEPKGFKVKIRDIIVKGGAEFIVAIAGNIMLMPGLSKLPQATKIDVDDDGNIVGLF